MRTVQHPVVRLNFRFRRLETRLFVSFLALAAAPSLLLSWIATDRIRDALDRVRVPGLEETLATSSIMGGELVDRLNREADILVTELGHSGALSNPDAIRQGALESRGFDFLAWRPTGDATVLIVERAAHDSVGSGLPTEDEWRRLEESEVPPLLSDGALRFFRSLPSGEGHLALGLRVSDDVARALGTNDETLARYLQLGYFIEIQKQLTWFSWGAVLLVTAAGAFVAARITARRIGRPVAELAKSADRLATGDLSHRADVRADGEIGELVASFNRMAGEIERSRADLLRAERIAAWRDVARRIAHEIRNPLTPVKLAVHRLRGRLASDAEAQESLRSIGEEVENLTRIAETFAEFARLPEPKFARVDVAAVARSVVELFKNAEPDVSIEVEGDAEVVARADADQMRRAITNLVKNAIEATHGLPEGARGRVIVRASNAVGRGGEGDPRSGRSLARLEVLDDGPGVPAEMRDAIFRPGFTTKTGGSGLGLALVHRIARDHEGELRLGGRAGDRSPSAGSGAVGGGHFVLEIPTRF